ncbi:MAG: hypothetical protein HYV60_05640 [Planctomycetia bacterium]|nr:hypothetical protein [Planctomycetia bacterium]
MRVVIVGIVIVGLPLLVTAQCPPTAAPQSPGAVPDQLALEICRQPANRDNCAVRYHVMMQLGQLVHASLGQGKLEQTLPFERAQEIRQRLDAQQEGRDGGYRMRDAPSAPLELYDLAADPGEARDIAAQHPELVARIAEYLQTTREDSPNWPLLDPPKSKPAGEEPSRTKP